VLIEVFYSPLMASAVALEEMAIRDFKKRRKSHGSKFQSKDDIKKYYLGPSGSEELAPQELSDSTSSSASTGSTKIQFSAEPGQRASIKLPSNAHLFEARSRSGSSSTLQNLREGLPVPRAEVIIPGIKKEAVKALFSQLEVIYLYNQKFSDLLHEKVSKWKWTQQLGELFLEMVDFLKAYVHYVNNYNASLDTLKQFQTIPEFVAWLEKAESRPECNGSTISMFLIMPIQRIPRYVLLLEDLVKHSPEPHIDHKSLVQALMRMKEIASLINEKKRESESFAYIVDIYNRLEPKMEDLCAAHRRFMKEGFLKFEGKAYNCFLFNDILLQTKEKGNGQLQLWTHITLRTAEVRNIEDDPQKKLKNCFEVVTPRKTFCFKAKDAEEKKEWVDIMLGCIKQQVLKSQSFSNIKKTDSISY